MLFSPNLGFSDLIFSSVFSSKAVKSRFLPFYFLPNHHFLRSAKQILVSKNVLFSTFLTTKSAKQRHIASTRPYT
jgi:hypothetical protein